MQPDFATGLWAVVTVGNETYIGELGTDGSGCPWMPNSLKLENAFKLTVMDIPVRGPQGETGFQHLVQCAPMDNGMHPATMYVVPQRTRYFEDMQEDDRKGHESLVQGTLESLERARAQASGITLPRLVVPPNVRS